MKLLIFCFFLSAAWAQRFKSEYVLDESVFPSGKLEENKALRNFVKIVEEHKMNVSVILSQATTYKNKNLKEALTLTLTFPTNLEAQTKPSLTKEQGKKFMKIATDQKLAGLVQRVVDGHVKQWSNQFRGVPETEAHRVLTTIQNGTVGFSPYATNYIAQYTLIARGADGKNQTTKAIQGDLLVDLVEVKNVPDEVVEKVKNAILSAYFTYEEEEFGRVVSDILEDTTKESWEVVDGEVGEHSYIDAKKSVLFKILDYNYLVYVI